MAVLAAVAALLFFRPLRSVSSTAGKSSSNAGRCALSDAHALDAHPPGVAGVAGVRPPPAHAKAMMTHAAVSEFVRPRLSATYAGGRERVMIKRLPTGYLVGCCGGWTGR
jgi:hypothetical protein